MYTSQLLRNGSCFAAGIREVTRFKIIRSVISNRIINCAIFSIKDQLKFGSRQ